MANLFWKTGDGIKALLETPFETEEAFEKSVFERSELLEDIFLLKRQIRGGGKPGIPDIVGLDNDGNVCIIEMKNVTVDVSIIPQVLEYAFWAETNPDSVKSLWLECKDKPDDITISWDDCQVRILVIAPSILRSTLDLVDRIDYPVDLIEIKRWIEGKNEFLLVNRLEDDKKPKPKPVSGLQTYDENFYKTHYNSESAKEFIRYTREVEQLIREKGWQLTTKFNKTYCGFKAGYRNAFGIHWVGSKTLSFFFKVGEKEAKRLKLPITKYQTEWKQAVYYIDPKKTKTKDFIPLFEFAYKKLTGA